MFVLDANILLYAYDATASQHRRVYDWLNAAVESGEAIGLPWISLWAFLRISTNPRLQHSALTVARSFELVREILRIPGVVEIAPGSEHLVRLEELATKGQAGGSHTTDAVLAALAVEYGATLVSADRDFARFPGLKWINPLD